MPLPGDPEGLTRWLAAPEDFAISGLLAFGEEQPSTERSQCSLDNLGIQLGDPGDVVRNHRIAVLFKDLHRSLQPRQVSLKPGVRREPQYS